MWNVSKNKHIRGRGRMRDVIVLSTFCRGPKPCCWYLCSRKTKRVDIAFFKLTFSIENPNQEYEMQSVGNVLPFDSWWEHKKYCEDRLLHWLLPEMHRFDFFDSHRIFGDIWEGWEDAFTVASNLHWEESKPSRENVKPVIIQEQHTHHQRTRREHEGQRHNGFIESVANNFHSPRIILITRAPCVGYK